MRPRAAAAPARHAARQAPVIQTQIILAVVGAVVMLVVGSSLARAFGIVGAAGLVRYRAKIDDPKDAGVMLSTLAVGLARGVGLVAARDVRDRLHAGRAVGGRVVRAGGDAAFRAESDSEGSGGDQAASSKQLLRALSRRVRAAHGVDRRNSSTMCELPLTARPIALSNAILKLDPQEREAVEWDEKKKKK